MYLPTPFKKITCSIHAGEAVGDEDDLGKDAIPIYLQLDHRLWRLERVANTGGKQRRTFCRFVVQPCHTHIPS
jgi:hypothetical protein